MTIRRMTSITAIVLTAVSLALAQPAKPWTPGQFGGLTAGKSTRKDVARIFGTAEPKKSATLETYKYDGKGDLGGTLLVDVDRKTGVVEAIMTQFSPNITRTQAFKQYGREYYEVRYSVAKCPQDGSVPPVYRDAKGGIELLEFPQKGLVLWPNQYGFDIAAAVFRAKRLPATKATCPK